ncbi:MAG: hypothetical protein CM15mP74_07740 [Halieaceae bacterium]|nr:MAG: hypothetical protein CM15mP74_07740 [Halieaceae bacterium]
MLVDTKFEFGYARDANGQENLIYMDEVGTPDSSRIWDAIAYRSGSVVENSKEEFRQALLRHVNDPQLLLDYSRFEERNATRRVTLCRLVSCIRYRRRMYPWRADYQPAVVVPDRPVESIMATLADDFGLADS